MKIDFILPDIGEGIVECELVEWRVQEGDAITEDQPVADVMTDKALVEITSMYTGVISKLHYQQGDIAKVHQPLFEIEVESDPSGESPTSVEMPQETPTDAVQPPSEPQTAALCSKPVASPAVRRLAREMQINLTDVKGSGKNGRIYKEDVQAHLKPQVTAQQTREPIRGIKALMAKQMQASASSIPHFTYVEEMDVTELEKVRAALKPGLEAQGIRLSLMPFFIKSLSLTLIHYPLLNSQVNEDCTEIIYQSDHNIGFAADTPAGLLVPNIKRVQDLSLYEIAQQLAELVDAARQGKLTTPQMKDGTITLSNIGVLGGTVATPIINAPEVAIAALGKIQTLPRFNEQGEVEARKIIQVSWSGDHRVLDGATMARFCNHWKSYLEDPVSMLAHLR